MRDGPHHLVTEYIFHVCPLLAWQSKRGLTSPHIQKLKISFLQHNTSSTEQHRRPESRTVVDGSAGPLDGEKHQLGQGAQPRTREAVLSFCPDTSDPYRRSYRSRAI